MSDEILELRNEIIQLNEFVGKLECENVELKDKNDKLEIKNAELKEENEKLKAEKFQESTIAIPHLPQMNKSHEEGLSETASKKFLAKSIPNWLFEVLEWIKRIEMADSSLSTSSETFKILCWPKLHENAKPHKIEKLKFSHEWDDEGNSRSILEKNGKDVVPFAKINPPKYITGIEQIQFIFFDGNALKFVQKILPVLNDITIKYKKPYFGKGFHNDRKIGKMNLLMELLAPKIYKLYIEEDSHDYYNRRCYDLEYFDESFPNLLDSVKSISLDCKKMSDRKINLLKKWLSINRKYGEPKILEIEIDFLLEEHGITLIEQIKEDFLNSNQASNFIIHICPLLWRTQRFEIDDFKLENEVTGEILEFYRKEGNDGLEHYLVRCKKGDENQRMDWEKEFIRESETTILMP